MIDEEQMLQLARLSELNIPEEKRRSVTSQLQRIEAVAQALEGVELDPFTDEIGPVWRP
jgi:Asp-tRNA(Asn)/Glu-tRNA(Gln) amidotransferase C subunit